jgi:isoleucyl-tRNA synthetase
VPGWDCHGLPIEWKIEEENYRSKGKEKPDLKQPAAMIEFRKECRAYAEHWVSVQSGEFKRLGIEGDFDKPYKTMDFHAEARIAGELLKIAKSGQLYRGSKPIMWSVVERTALAEAEIEYQPYESDTIWVKFPVQDLRCEGYTNQIEAIAELLQKQGENSSPEAVRAYFEELRSPPSSSGPPPHGRSPATAPSPFRIRIAYGLYEVTAAENDFGPQPGEKLIFADALAEECFAKAKLEFKRARCFGERTGREWSAPIRSRASAAAMISRCR